MSVMVHDESCPCPRGEEGEVCCSSSPRRGSDVISLCDIREKQVSAGRTERLLRSLCDLHSLGIRVHNEVIERSQVSVLSELCRAAGIYFDLAGEELRTSVLTPSSIYGCSREKVYGKEPLQRRINRHIDDEVLRGLWNQLTNTPIQLWCYHGRRGQAFDDAHLLLGPRREEVRRFAGIIARSGEIQRRTGHYLGWAIEFEGAEYLVFGFALSSASVARLVKTVPHLVSEDSRRYEESLELSLIRAAVDPFDRHHRSQQASPFVNSHGGYRPGRRWLLHKIWSRLQEEFSRPRCKLSLRAHIATVFTDDVQGIADYLTAVDQIREDVLLQFGPGRPGEAEVTLEDVLKVYHLSPEGMIEPAEGLDEHPVAVLLLDGKYLDALDIDRLTPIREALFRARAGVASAAAAALEAAWATYLLEQHWLGTYGLGLGKLGPSGEPLSALGPEAISTLLPDMRALFDHRFFEQPFEALAMPNRDRSRMARAMRKARWFKEPGLLATLPEDDVEVSYLEGVGDKTFASFRRGLLETGLLWRWNLVGLEPRSFHRKGLAKTDRTDLHCGLDELADLFE